MTRQIGSLAQGEGMLKNNYPKHWINITFQVAMGTVALNTYVLRQVEVNKIAHNTTGCTNPAAHLVEKKIIVWVFFFNCNVMCPDIT